MTNSDQPYTTPLQAPVPLSPVSRKFISSSSDIFNNYDQGILPMNSPSHASITSPDLPPTKESLLNTSISTITSKLPPGITNFIQQNVGLTLVGCAQLFFVLMSLTVKYFLSTTKISAFTLIFVRMSITAIFCTLSLIFVIKDKNPILGPEGIRLLLFLRGLFGFISLLGMYQSLRGLTVSDAVTIQFLAPTLTGLLGYLFLKEKMKLKEIIAGFACLVGVVLVSRPSFIFGKNLEDGNLPGSLPEGGGTRLDLPPPPPGEGDSEGIQTPERAISVAWAFVMVFFTAIACE